MKYVIFTFLLCFSLVAQVEDNFQSQETNEEAKEIKYIGRIFYGKSYASSLNQILIEANINSNDQDDNMFGISVEKYLLKNAFDLDINFTLQSGFFYHRQRIVNENAPYQEPHLLNGKDAFQFNIGLKAYWTRFPWNHKVRTRFAFMEGVSYTTRYLDIESQNFNRKGKKNMSKFLNYLEFNLAFNMEDIFRSEKLENTYLGFGISHRSGIFGAINGVNGGSNIIVLTLEKEF